MANAKLTPRLSSKLLLLLLQLRQKLQIVNVDQSKVLFDLMFNFFRHKKRSDMFPEICMA